MLPLGNGKFFRLYKRKKFNVRLSVQCLDFDRSLDKRHFMNTDHFNSIIYCKCILHETTSSLGASSGGLGSRIGVSLNDCVRFFTEMEVEMKDFSSFPIVIDQSDHVTNTSWWY